MFFILSLLTWKGAQLRMPFLSSQFYILALILIAYGGLTELAQGWFTKTRHTEMLDFLTDIAGVILGFLLYQLVKRKTSSSKEWVKY
jgi:hypothetical protein